MRNVMNPFQKKTKFINRTIIAASIASVTLYSTFALAQSEMDYASESFIPLAPGFEDPEQQEELIFNMPGPQETVSLARFKDDYASLKESIQERLGDLSVEDTFDRPGSEYSGLPGVDVSKYKSDLEEQAAIQRETRLLEMRLTQAQVAKELWGVLYQEDLEAESEEREAALQFLEAQQQQIMDSRSAAPSNTSDNFEEEEEENTESNEPKLLMTTSDNWTLYHEEGHTFFARSNQDGTPDRSTIKGVEDVMMERVNTALDSAQEENERSNTESSSTSLPGVLSVSGVGNDLRARLNDPQLGLIDVSIGDTLVNGARITNISPQGVTFTTEEGTRHTAGVGSSGFVVQ